MDLTAFILARLDFILARLDEDEAAAREAAGWSPSGRERAPGEWRRDGINSVEDSDGRLVIYGDGPAPDSGQADHIARHDPARVLAEVAAMRRMLDLRYSWALQIEKAPDQVRHVFAAQVSAADAIIRAFVSIWSDHEDYDEEWRP